MPSSQLKHRVDLALRTVRACTAPGRAPAARSGSVLGPTPTSTGSARLPLAAIALALALLAPGAPALAATIFLTPAASEVDLDDVFSVELRISGLPANAPPALGAFDLDIDYDPNVLSFEGASFGDPGLGDQLEIGGFAAIDITSENAGTISLFELSLSPTAVLEAGQAGSFRLAELQFRAGLGVTTLEIDPASILSDAVGSAIPIESVGNAVVTAVPEPTAAFVFAAGLGTLALRLRARR